MKKIFIYIWLIIILLFMSCSRETDIVAEYLATIKIQQNSFSRAVDEDNLESEQAINKLAVFFAEPASDVFTHKYVNAGFTVIDDYVQVTLPVDLSELDRKDIYVVTNYGNVNFDDVTNLESLKAKTTPEVNPDNNLNPADGLCMYGKTVDFNFSSSAGNSAEVYVVRTCAKYRVRITFPGNPTLSMDNTFRITGAAGYTYLVNGTETVIPSDAYFDFAGTIALEPDATGAYVNMAYVYEATQAPEIHIYTRMNNSEELQEFSTELPVPVRNYLYDINVRIYESTTRGCDLSGYTHKVTVTVYNEKGEATCFEAASITAYSGYSSKAYKTVDK